MTNNANVDLNSHDELFRAIMKQVSGTALSAPFLSILQHLLQIDTSHAASEHIWMAAERLVARAKMIESADDADKLLMLHTSTYSLLEKLRRNKQQQQQQQSTTTTTTVPCCCQSAPSSSATPTVAVPPAPPPVPPPLPPLNLAGEQRAGNAGKRKLNFAEQLSQQSKRLQSTGPGAQQAKSLKPINGSNSNAVEASSSSCETTPRSQPDSDQDQDEGPTETSTLPQPRNKLKTLAWNKLSASRLRGNTETLWSKGLHMFSRGDPSTSLDFATLDTLFAQTPVLDPAGANNNNLHINNNNNNNNNNNTTSGDNNNNNNTNNNGTLDRKKNKELNLLDSKRSLNVNIFLKQFRGGGVNDLLQLIKDSDGSDLGTEKIRSLVKILPELDEIERLTSYTGDLDRLGTAEQFYLSLLQVSDYKYRIDYMLLKEEFRANMEYIKPSLDALIDAAKAVKDSRSLQEIMYLVLQVGNYLNSGSYGGNAAGFRLGSLWKLVEVRANTGNITLLHFVVKEAEAQHMRMAFSTEMPLLEDASKLSLEAICTDVRNMKDKTLRLQGQLPDLQGDQAEFCEAKEFLQSVQRETASVDGQLNEIESLRVQLADYFCEDRASFKIEECFKILHAFTLRFNKAKQENAERRERQLKADERRRRQSVSATTPTPSIHNVNATPIGPFGSLTRRRVSTPNSNRVIMLQHSTQSEHDLQRLNHTSNNVGDLVDILEQQTNNGVLLTDERGGGAAPMMFRRTFSRRNRRLDTSVDRERQPIDSGNNISMQPSSNDSIVDTPPNRWSRTRRSASSRSIATDFANSGGVRSPLTPQTPTVPEANECFTGAAVVQSNVRKSASSQAIQAACDQSSDLNGLLDNLQQNVEFEIKSLGRTAKWRSDSATTEKPEVESQRSVAETIQPNTDDVPGTPPHHPHFANHRSRFASPDAPATPTSSRSTAKAHSESDEPREDTTHKNSFRSWRERILDDMPDYDKHSQTVEHSRAQITSTGALLGQNQLNETMTVDLNEISVRVNDREHDIEPHKFVNSKFGNSRRPIPLNFALTQTAETQQTQELTVSPTSHPAPASVSDQAATECHTASSPGSSVISSISTDEDDVHIVVNALRETSLNGKDSPSSDQHDEGYFECATSQSFVDINHVVVVEDRQSVTSLGEDASSGISTSPPPQSSPASSLKSDKTPEKTTTQTKPETPKSGRGSLPGFLKATRASSVRHRASPSDSAKINNNNNSNNNNNNNDSAKRPSSARQTSTTTKNNNNNKRQPQPKAVIPVQKSSSGTRVATVVKQQHQQQQYQQQQQQQQQPQQQQARSNANATPRTEQASKGGLKKPGGKETSRSEPKPMNAKRWERLHSPPKGTAIRLNIEPVITFRRGSVDSNSNNNSSQNTARSVKSNSSKGTIVQKMTARPAWR